MISHGVESKARTAASAAPPARISAATCRGTTISGPASCRKSRSWASASWMSGDALTAGRSAKAELTLQVFEVDDECIRLRPRELHQELSAAQTSNVGSLLLRQLSTFVPMDRRRNPKLTSELLGRTPESGEDIVGKLQRDRRHARSCLAPIMRRFLPAGRISRRL